jgi:hypothetical protein
MKILELVTQPLLMPMRSHALAALVLGNFCFPSFLKRAHSDFWNCRFDSTIEPSTLQLQLIANRTAIPSARSAHQGENSIAQSASCR